MNRSDWVNWWLETNYGANNSKIAGESQHGAALEIWKQFEQVAHAGTGGPKVMCKRCNAILEHPYATNKDDGGTGTGRVARLGMATLTRHLQTAGCRKTVGRPLQRDGLTRSLQTAGDNQPFSQERWERKLLEFIAVNQLPFQIVENLAFRSLISQTQSAPSPLIIPSADSIRRRLSACVKERQYVILRLLPKHARISVSLDRWTSPYGQAFMAITGYFIDADWVHREVLLGFKPLSGIHSGATLSAMLMRIFNEHGIQDRIFGLTTHQASNNKPLVEALQRTLLHQSSVSGFNVIRIPSLAHVIQSNVADLEPLPFWKENQFRFPAIAALARDVLAIPATGAGVERLFNTARDFFHYRREYLESYNIEELMMYLCTSRFDLEAQDAKEFEQFFGSNERQILIEEKVEKPEDVDTGEISDTEEQGDEPGSRDLVDVHDDNDDATIMPSIMPSQVRTSGRKRRRMEDDLYEHS
ncbi:hypothetical protein N7465_006543 [Penicillium sp. CMV-2018d]|nr:hypothetical protein N7465_006543 [Penicillium sp. CMV-2018d]